MITLKTLPAASAQEVFDQVKAHLLAQKQCSYNGKMCLYRGPDGLKCAAGCLIGDDEYNPKMDSNQIEDGTWTGLVDAGLVPYDHAQLIWALQRAHDNQSGYGSEVFEEKVIRELKEVAARFNLNYD